MFTLKKNSSLRGRCLKTKKPGIRQNFGGNRILYSRIMLGCKANTLTKIIVSTGIWFYLHHTLLSRIVTIFWHKFTQFNTRLRLITHLYTFKNRARLQHISVNSFIKISKARGSKCIIKRSKLQVRRLLLILPSGSYKFFNNYEVGLPWGGKATKTNKMLRAGYWLQFGKRPIVRGVAMNPVDHPNGGRTKTLLCPKTPWATPARPR